MTTYIIAATGGIDVPSFHKADTLDAARKIFDDFAQTCISYPGERVDLLQLDDNKVSTIVSAEYHYPEDEE